jgi:hypothetical protein
VTFHQVELEPDLTGKTPVTADPMLHHALGHHLGLGA